MLHLSLLTRQRMRPELRSPIQDSAQSRGEEGWQMVAPTMTWVTLPHYTHMRQQSVGRHKFTIIFHIDIDIFST